MTPGPARPPGGSARPPGSAAPPAGGSARPPGSAAPPAGGSARPAADDFASDVLDVVDSIPPGRVMSYGDIAEHLAAGPGPRQVGRVLAVYGGAVPWWRVTHSDGTPAPGHDSRALEYYLAEGTPLRSDRPPVRVDMRRARWPGR